MPGPGQYRPSTAGTQRADPKYGFGTGGRNGKMNANKTTPGPGNYDINGHPTKMSAARTVMTPRRPDTASVRGRGAPGPG